MILGNWVIMKTKKETEPRCFRILCRPEANLVTSSGA